MPRGDDLDALIARAQDGDVRAFEELLASHLPQVRRFARAFAVSEPDADDLAQEALIKAYKSLRLFRYQSAFSSWLYAIVRNAFLDAARSRGAFATGQILRQMPGVRGAPSATSRRCSEAENPLSGGSTRSSRSRSRRSRPLSPGLFMSLS